MTPTTINHHNQSQSITINHNQSQSITINHNQLQSTTINHNQPQSTTINHNQPQSITINHNQPSPIMTSPFNLYFSTLLFISIFFVHVQHTSHIFFATAVRETPLEPRNEYDSNSGYSYGYGHGYGYEGDPSRSDSSFKPGSESKSGHDTSKSGRDLFYAKPSKVMNFAAYSLEEVLAQKNQITLVEFYAPW